MAIVIISMCRLCLALDKTSTNIFSDIAGKQLVQEKILKFLQLDIKKDDSVSKFICNNCWRKLQDFNCFYDEVHMNQGKLASKLFQILVPNCIETPKRDICKIENTSGIVETNIEVGHKEFEKNKLKNLNVNEIQDETNNISATSIEKIEISETNLTKMHYQFVEEKIIDLYCGIESDCDRTISSNITAENPKTTAENSIKPNILESETTDEESDFPETLMDCGKLVVFGNELEKVMSKFFNLNCDICSDNRAFKNINLLFSHYNEVHSVKEYVKCCGIKLNRKTMAFHLVKHLQPDALRCNDCGKMFTRPSNLRYHMRNHLPDEQKPLACSKCSKRFARIAQLTTHEKTHLPLEKRKSYYCAPCNKKFFSISNYCIHKQIHKGQIFPCNICGKCFNNKHKLKKHSETHDEEHPVQCEICEKWLKHKRGLPRHMKQHTELEEKVYKCTECDYTTSTSGFLKRHKIRHSTDRPFLCSQCGQSFKSKSYLLAHMAQHTGAPNFSCDFCPRKFVSKSNWYGHRKRMHPKELEELIKRKTEAKKLICEQLTARKDAVRT